MELFGIEPAHALKVSRDIMVCHVVLCIPPHAHVLNDSDRDSFGHVIVVNHPSRDSFGHLLVVSSASIKRF